MLKKKTILLFIIFIFAILLAMRNDYTPDTAAYRQLYEESSLNSKSSIEFLYIAVNYLFCKVLKLDFIFFLYFVTLSLFFAWYKLTSKLTNCLSVAFFSFIPFYGLYFFGITIRASIAVIICYSAILILLKNHNIKGYLFYYLLIFLALGFHMSALIFLILPLVAQRHYRNITLYVFLALSAIAPLFSYSIPFIKDFGLRYLTLIDFTRVRSYLINSSGSMTFSLTLLKNLFFGAIFIFFRNEIKTRRFVYNFFLNTYLVGIFLLALFSFVIAGSRLAMMFLFFEYILITLLYKYSTLKKQNTIMFIILAAIVNFIEIIEQGNGLIC